ncbi:hypothetical protein SAMN05421734_11328 [Pelagirhabdus alkalitolerans]|uniref:Uncharacterized protein n=1 Tax=Pelagirhabdus alkalitolerans TaxID=1612202 RepID=A0A1G6N163_9BACI|nr:DUF5388 domain-containing protein [Pelagirhabdus alkalitolerans]SDC61204.1 hypothetical protein SAMN05421734_11328 [Pelagirhabdus alkalitolerans]
MSDLLKKRNKASSLERPPEVKPKNTFDIDSIDKQYGLHNLENKKKQQTKKSTTVRVSTELKDKLNALVTIGVADNVDTVIDIMLEEYTNAFLDKDEKKQLELLQSIYQKKQKPHH